MLYPVVVSPRAGQCDFALRQMPRRFAAPVEPTDGVVRVQLGAGSVRLALEPQLHVALWCAGQRAQPSAERAQQGRAYSARAERGRMDEAVVAFDALRNKIGGATLVDMNKTLIYDDVDIALMQYALELCAKHFSMSALKVNASQ